MSFKQGDNHRVQFQSVRRDIETFPAKDIDTLEGKRQDLSALDIAGAAHISARTQYLTDPSDETMINLIGTYARLSRCLYHFDNIYGRK